MRAGCVRRMRFAYERGVVIARWPKSSDSPFFILPLASCQTVPVSLSLRRISLFSCGKNTVGTKLGTQPTEGLFQ
jgi:hypothetical protein